MVVQAMTASEHAQRLLAEADADLAAGEYNSISCRLWSAVEHAVAAVAVDRGWECEGDEYRDLRPVVQRLGEETGDERLVRRFHSASMFFYNSRYTFLEDYEIEFFSPSVHRFVPIMLTHLN